MKNEEKKEKKDKKILQKQKPSQENKKQIKKTNIKNMTENKITNQKNHIPNIYKIKGTKLFNDDNIENKKETNEVENSFEGKMFYEVSNKNKNNFNFNTPIKTINVYRNNFFNYTNNNLISNLLCDVSDENKNVMVSELDLNISNSRAPTPRVDIIQPPQKKFLEKQNTEVDFKSQLESNIIKILEKNIIPISNNSNKNILEKKSISYNITEVNKNSNLSSSNKLININNINKESINKENNNKIILEEGKIIKNIKKRKLNTQNISNNYLSKVNSRELKNKYLVSSTKPRKARYFNSPNINVHKMNNIMSPKSKKYINKKIFYNNYTKTDICIKKYKTIIDNNNILNKNNNQINSVKFYNQIKKNKNEYNKAKKSISKKNIKSYIICNHHNKISNPFSSNNNINITNSVYKPGDKAKSKNILLTNITFNSNNNNISNSNTMNYSKYKNILNELHKNISTPFQTKHDEKSESKANSHRNKNNQTYFIFNLEHNNGRKTSNTIGNYLQEKNEKKNLIITSHSIDKNVRNKFDINLMNTLTKQNSNISLLKKEKKKEKIYLKKRTNKNNSCQLDQKFNNILSDSFHEKNKFKYNNNISLFGVEKINIEMNKKCNNSNIEILPKDLLNNEKEETKKINSNKNIETKKTKNKKINNINIEKKINSKNKNINNMNNNMITFRNKFINNDNPMKKYLSNSKDNKDIIKDNKKFIQQQNNNKNINKLNKNGNINFNYHYHHFSPSNNIIYKNNNINNNKTGKKNNNNNGEGNKINIDIKFNNNINYIYIIKKNRFKNKSNKHLFTMK